MRSGERAYIGSIALVEEGIGSTGVSQQGVEAGAEFRLMGAGFVEKGSACCQIGDLASLDEEVVKVVHGTPTGANGSKKRSQKNVFLLTNLRMIK